MSDFWLNCDNCKRTEVGVTWVNGMRFCAKCYQETFGNTNPFEKELRDKIADLEAKLAESEKKIEELKGERLSIYTDNFKNTQVINGVHFTTEQLIVVGEYIQYLQKTNSEFKEQNEQLKQQLAEKDEEIESKSQEIGILHNRICNDMLSIEMHELRELSRNQVKISFALEQLEKVKELAHILLGNFERSKEYQDPKFRGRRLIEYYDLTSGIDNQIEELKRGGD